MIFFIFIFLYSHVKYCTVFRANPKTNVCQATNDLLSPPGLEPAKPILAQHQVLSPLTILPAALLFTCVEGKGRGP